MLVMYNGYFVLTMFYDYDWWLKSNDIDKYMIKLSHGKSKYMTMTYYDTMSMSIWLCLYLCLWLCLWSKMSTMNDIMCMFSLCLFMTDEVTYFIFQNSDRILRSLFRILEWFMEFYFMSLEFYFEYSEFYLELRIPYYEHRILSRIL